jgi:phosphopantothenoylcysteine decarboxylase/phosphopantothenate--cysteine ligase
MTNPSTGKMGHALALVAARRSAEVHLVTGPSALSIPQGVNGYRVTSAEEMKQAVLDLAPTMDAIVMAAAVGDYRPQAVASQKLKKASPTMEVTLVRNPDILSLLGENKLQAQVLVGFAAETENLLENAREKLVKKNLDFIVANDLSVAGSGFACDTNQVKIIDRSGEVADLPCLPKDKVAALIWDRVERSLPVREGATL